MKITSIEIKDAETVGHSTEIYDDRSLAKFTLYCDANGKGKAAFTISGTPRELRKIGRGILDGLKSEKVK